MRPARHHTVISFCLIIATASVISGNAIADVVVLEPGFAVRSIPYDAQTLHGSGAGIVSVACSPVPWGGDLFIGWNDIAAETSGIDRINASGAVSSYPVAGSRLVTSLAFGPGGSPVGDSLFIGYLLDDISRIDPGGGGGTFGDNAVNVAVDSTGAFGGDLFYESDQGGIYTDDMQGGGALFSTWLSGPMRFGPGGGWGTDLYATALVDRSLLYRVDPQGIASFFLQTTASSFSFDFGQGPGFGGDMFLTDGGIQRVAPDGTRTPWATGAGVVAFCNGALYTTGCGTGFCRISVGIEVTARIDIRPGKFPNTINLKSSGSILAAILGSASLDVETLDPATVRLAGAAATTAKKKLSCEIDDADSDGYDDLVCHFETSALRLASTDTSASIEAVTFDGATVVKGRDSIVMVN